MAFAGVRVEMYRGLKQVSDPWMSYLQGGKLEWSEAFPSPATSGVTTRSAVQGTTDVDVIFRVYSTVEIYIAIGASPDASVEGKRALFTAGGSLVFQVAKGDKLAWVKT